MSRSTVGAVVALLIVSPVASAGPIGWSYEAETRGLNGGCAYFGTEYQTTIDPATHEEVRTPYLMIGQIDRFARGSGAGAGTVGIGSFDPTGLQAVATDDAWANDQLDRFNLQVTLTDTASLQTTTLNYFVGGQSNGYFQTGTGVVSLWVEDRTDTFSLGGNRYSVRPVTRESESGAYLDLEVTAVAATPEPGTIVLAGLGLAVCGVRRLRRA